MLDLEKSFDRMLFQLIAINAIFDDLDDARHRREQAQEARRKDERAVAFRNLESMARDGARAERQAAAKAAAAAKRPAYSPEGHTSPPVVEPWHWMTPYTRTR